MASGVMQTLNQNDHLKGWSGNYGSAPPEYRMLGVNKRLPFYSGWQNGPLGNRLTQVNIFQIDVSQVCLGEIGVR